MFHRYFVIFSVPFVTSVGVFFFDPSFCLHKLHHVLNMFAVLFPFGFLQFHPIPLHELRFPVIPLEPHRLDSWHDRCVVMCRPDALDRCCNTAACGKIDSTVHNHVPMVVGTPITSSPIRMFSNSCLSCVLLSMSSCFSCQHSLSGVAPSR